MKKLLGIFCLLSSMFAASETIKVGIKGMSCESCVGRITDKLKSTQKCESIQVSLKEKMATFKTKNGAQLTDDEIKTAIKSLGYEITEISRVQ